MSSSERCMDSCSTVGRMAGGPTGSARQIMFSGREKTECMPMKSTSSSEMRRRISNTISAFTGWSVGASARPRHTGWMPPTSTLGSCFHLGRRAPQCAQLAAFFAVVVTHSQRSARVSCAMRDRCCAALATVLLEQRQQCASSTLTM